MHPQSVEQNTIILPSLLLLLLLTASSSGKKRPPHFIMVGTKIDVTPAPHCCFLKVLSYVVVPVSARDTVVGGYDTKHSCTKTSERLSRLYPIRFSFMRRRESF